jgi:hypothetical protein
MLVLPGQIVGPLQALPVGTLVPQERTVVLRQAKRVGTLVLQERIVESHS